MRTWWVNQNQTYRQEIEGGYLWSPKRRADGARNHFYETMREVAPGDLVFSFCDTRIKAIGLARSVAYTAPRPPEFGKAGENWDVEGWRVDVGYVELKRPYRPADAMDLIRPLLPPRYAPLQPNGRGLQGVYLTELPAPLAMVLLDLAGPEAAVFKAATPVIGAAAPDFEQAEQIGEAWDEREERRIAAAHAGEAEALREIRRARRGYGLFRKRVLQVERGCRLSGIAEPAFLICRHIKPWRYSTDNERLDGENGLLFSPNADYLFARGLITFDANGDLLVSPSMSEPLLTKLHIPAAFHANVGGFTDHQAHFLGYHKDRLFLRAAG